LRRFPDGSLTGRKVPLETKLASSILQRLTLETAAKKVDVNEE